MKQESIVIAYLSISLLVLQYFLMRSEKKVSFLEGKQAVYDSFAESDNQNNCYALNNDCKHNPNGK